MKHHIAFCFLLSASLLTVFGPLSKAAVAACVAPSGVEGEIIFNRQWSVMQFCNGDKWIGMGGSSVAVSGNTGALQFNAGDNSLGADAGLVWDNTQKYLGVGTAFPGVRLTIAGDGTEDWGHTGLAFQNTGTGGKTYSISSRGNGQFAIGDETASLIRFSILSNGRVNIGLPAASPYLLNVGGGVHIEGAIAIAGNYTMSGADFTMYSATRCAPLCNNRGRALVHESGHRLTINYAGDFEGGTVINSNLSVTGEANKPGGGAWVASSDARLKNIDGDYTKGLEAITALRPVSYHYREGNARKEPADKAFVGLIAQEVKDVMPEAVNLRDDGYYDLDSTPISYAVINAIKALKAENDALRARLEALEAKP